MLRKVHRTEYVLRDGVSFKMPEPNYMGTGMALCAVLQRDETLVDWLIKNS